MGLNRGYTPWRPEVSPFNQDFRDLINQGLESVSRFEQIEESINRVLVERFPQGAGGAVQFFTARLTADATVVVDGQQWLYPGWEEQARRLDDADLEWIAVPDGRNSIALGPAHNTAETVINNAEWHGSGYNRASLPVGFALQSVPRGTVIHNFMSITVPPLDPKDPPTTEVWFDKDNKPDGECPP